MSLSKNNGFSMKINHIGKILELDPRFLSMIGALLAIWIFFDIASGGIFLSPRNLWNLSVQISVVALISTGMVLIIVSRNIDLSTGSLLAFLGMVGGYIQAELFTLEGPYAWWVAIFAMLFFGALFGAVQGAITAYFAIPAFVVTLGGLMFWRGAGWFFTQGRTITPLDSTFSVLGGGSIGEMWSWVVGIIGIVILASVIFWKRRSRQKLNFPTKPLWLECLLILIWSSIIVLFVYMMNAYNFPRSENGRGIPVPVLILLVVSAIMIYIAKMTKFGRYIYGYGGNPEAAELSGVDTKKIITLSFALIGSLTAIGAMISTARLNAAPLSIGNLLELQVIAAAVIGGTSLAGGMGTVFGALVGALLMQSLQNGMVLLGVQSAPQKMILAVVLIFAVWLDIIYQKKRR